MTLVATMRPPEMSRPGSNPAANRPATDTFMMNAYRIMIPEGGIMGPMTDEAAVIAAANERE